MRTVGRNIRRAVVVRILKRGDWSVRKLVFCEAIDKNVSLVEVVFGGYRTSDAASVSRPTVGCGCLTPLVSEPEAQNEPPAPEHLIPSCEHRLHHPHHRIVRAQLATIVSHLPCPPIYQSNQFIMAEEDGQELVTKPFKFVTGKSDNPSLKNMV